MKITNSNFDGEGSIWLSKETCTIETSNFGIKNFVCLSLMGVSFIGKIKICMSLIIWIFGGNKEKYKFPAYFPDTGSEQDYVFKNHE